MKGDRQIRHPISPPDGAAPATVRRFPTAKQWLFRLLAFLLVPLLLLLLLEAVLRMTYTGYSTRFFLPVQIRGTNHFVTNDRYGLRFFPPALARSPIPYAFAAHKQPGTFRVFLFGESAALGDPRPAFGVGRYLQALLSERYPSLRFEVVPAAMTAINSHALREIARECRAYEGDLWIVYMGNNEMAGPFGATTIFGPQTPSLAAIRASLAFRSTRTGQWIEFLSRRMRGAASGSARWEGLQMFLDQQLPPDDPRRKTVAEHFRRNLRDLLEAATDAGIPVILSTVAGNLRDCGPFASRHSGAFNPANSNRWDELIALADRSVAAGDAVAARQLLSEAQTLDPRFAELRFRLGRVELAVTNLVAAREHFLAARDFDALPFRTDSMLNEIIRSTAGMFAEKRVELLDAEQALQPAFGVPGREAFFDHVHFTFDGNYQLALLFAAKVATRLPETRNEWAPQPAVERRLALTDWNRVSVLESVLQRFGEAPFTNQLNHTERMVSLSLQLAEWRQKLHPRFYLETRELCEAAIRRDPTDPRLRENYAEFLETIGSPAEALGQWQEIAALLPDHYIATFQQGRLCSRLKRYDEARALLSRALAVRPDLDAARVEIGQSWFREGKHAEAIAVYSELLRRQPRDARVLRHLADPLAALGKRAEATQALREAVSLRPNYSEARYFLAVELAEANQIEEARHEFEEVLRIRPDHVLARLNLGVALARLRRFNEARGQFEAVLRLDPENERARQHLQTLESLAKPAPEKPQ